MAMQRYIPPPANCGTGTWGGTTSFAQGPFAAPSPWGGAWGGTLGSWLPVLLIGGLVLMGMGILKEPRG